MILNKSSKNLLMADYTTLKIGGEAEIVFFPSNIDELISVRDFLVSNNRKFTVIGAGSNLLISSKGISGGVILTQNLNNYEILDEVTYKADSGMKSAKLAKIMQENNLAGLEFLIGIPGSVGGAVTMNSSAHGQAIKDVIEAVEVLDLCTGEIIKLDKSQLNLNYRESFVESSRHLVLNATFRLAKADPKDILEKMNFHLSWRKEKHPPLTEPNAGSTFRNPAERVYIARLLDHLGAKNWTEGKARISSRHANFIVNMGGATSLEVSKLMLKMYNEVKNHFDYELKAEIKYVGDPTTEEEEIWKILTAH